MLQGNILIRKDDQMIPNNMEKLLDEPSYYSSSDMHVSHASDRYVKQPIVHKSIDKCNRETQSHHARNQEAMFDRDKRQKLQIGDGIDFGLIKLHS